MTADVDLLRALSALPAREAQAEISGMLARLRLSTFVKLGWQVFHEDDEPLEWNWHIDCICDHLEAAFREEIVWLLINVQPGFTKSLLTSVFFPSWVWLHRPGRRFLCSSTNDPVTYRDARRHKEMITHPWFLDTFRPGWELSREQKAAGDFANTAGGERKSRTVRAGMIGLRPHIRILDDPVDPLKDLEADRLDQINEWLDQIFLKRRARKTSPLILIMQRLHENDPCGYLLRRDKHPPMVHLSLPNEYVPKRAFATHIINIATGKPWKDPRTKKGQLIAPELMDAEQTEMEREGGESTYQAQYQQDPTPRGGIIFKREMFKRWSYEPTIEDWSEDRPTDHERGDYPTYPLPEKFDYTIATADFNNLKADRHTKDTDYAVIQIWGVLGEDRYLRREVREKMGVSASIRVTAELQAHYPDLAAIVIEKAANGPTVIAGVRALLGIGDEEKRPSRYHYIRDWSVQGETKVQRAKAMSHVVEAGRIYIPDEREHGEMEYWLSEVCGFPGRRRDDRVDCLTCAVTFLERRPFG